MRPAPSPKPSRRQPKPGADPILLFGASAIADRRDVLPAALERAGGQIAVLGMPVDPGNLLMAGTLKAGTGARPAGLRPLAPA